MHAMSAKDEQRAKRIHADAVVCDSHSDIGIDIFRKRIRGQAGALRDVHLPKLRAGGVKASFVTVGGDSGSLGAGSLDNATMLALSSIDAFREENHSCAMSAAIATSVEEVFEAAKKDQVSFIMHLEGGLPLGHDLGFLRAFHDRGVRSVGITWNYRNQLADGILERSRSGLSNFGVDVVKELNALHMIVDVAHLSERAFWDVIEMAEGPVLDTHANARALCDHPRNLLDEQIRALAETGGIIGACCYSEFIRQTHGATLEGLLDHIDHIAELVGPEHVSIGADFMDYSERMAFRMRTSPPSQPIHPEGIRDTTEFLNITRGLIKRGYSDEEIRGILGGNILRVLREVLGR